MVASRINTQGTLTIYARYMRKTRIIAELHGVCLQDLQQTYYDVVKEFIHEKGTAEFDFEFTTLI